MVAGESPMRRKASFRDVFFEKSTFSVQEDAVTEPAFEEASEDEFEEDDEVDEECPTVKVSVEEKRRLRGQWTNALIVKLIGHSVGMEYERALFGGPWVIADHYVAVSRWRIGRLIGKPLKVDKTPMAASRGRFARLCVEVDLEKPLLSKFRLRRGICRIEYEAVHVICFKCGVYGHQQDTCGVKGTDKGPSEAMVETGNSGDGQNVHDKQPEEESQEKGDDIGKGGAPVRKVSGNGQGSRYDILREMRGDNEDLEDAQVMEKNMENNINFRKPKSKEVHKGKQASISAAFKGKSVIINETDLLPSASKGENQVEKFGVRANITPVVISEKSNMDLTLGPIVVASLDQHILVRGNNQNQSIPRTMIPADCSLAEMRRGFLPNERIKLGNFNDPSFPYRVAPNIMDSLPCMDGRGDEELEDAKT
ncbi:hypothetical protein PTKIN_Ptkin04bG0157300 [Pterospermum kingtungense]